MYRRTGNPIALIILLSIVALAVLPSLIRFVEAFLPLMVLIGIAAVAAVVMFGSNQVSPVQRMLANFLGIGGQPGATERRYTQQESESFKRRLSADKAVIRAGYRPGDNPDIELADVGLLVYEGGKDPKICRLSDVPTNASHVRPFIVLDLPNLPDTGGNGVIRFNLVDGSGKLRYTARSRYTVKRGQNFITPKTWLPLVNQDVGGDWSLQVCVGDGTPFAIHEFEWLKIGGEVRAYFTGDGEIDELMQPAVSQTADEPMSLDELLADQDQVAPLIASARR